MKQYYFVYNGKTYGIGTIINIKQFDTIVGKSHLQEATFAFYDPEKEVYMLKVNGHMLSCPTTTFNDICLGVTNNIDMEYVHKAYEQHVYENRKRTFKEELNIDGLLIAWMWYIFIMAIAVIFNGRIGIWICASIVFFKYRNKKLREAGFKK